MMTDDRLLARREVEALTGLRTSHLYSLMRQQKFPAPLKVAAQAVRWKRSEVLAWIDSRPRATGGRQAQAAA